MRSELFLPSPEDLPFTAEAAWKWYQNIPLELGAGLFAHSATELLRRYYHEAGLLTRWKRPFFKHHYCESLAQAVNTFFGARHTRPRLLDLGSGMGTQSILFGLLGANVTSLDMDVTSLAVLQARRRLYERVAQRPVPVMPVAVDAFTFDYAACRFDGLYSLFALNTMQPTGRLLPLILSAIKGPGQVVIQDGNGGWWLRAFRPPVAGRADRTPEMAERFRKAGFRATARGLVALPPVLWRMPLTATLDNCLRRVPALAVSYQLIAERVS